MGIRDIITGSYCDSVTLYTPATTNEYGENTFTESTLTCRVSNINKVIKTKKGEEVLCDTLIYSDTNIAINSKIVYNGNIMYSEYTKENQDKTGNVMYYKTYCR
jgi:hypothetical protein